MSPQQAEIFSCRHCGEPMQMWSTPTFNFTDGLGFGTDILRVCFNDLCPMYVKGWNTLFEKYGKIGSMRFYRNPVDGDEGVLPVAHKDAMRGDIISDLASP
ncbi:MAG: hypothetical protein H7832_14750 [Magnetococcus sp. DMHC-6]